MVLKVLMTGGTGVLGRQILVDSYEMDDIEICAPTRKQMDISSKDSVMKYFSKGEFDMILHCAAYTKTVKATEEVVECTKINVEGTWNLLQEAIRRDIRFVYISTDYVFDGLRGDYRTTDHINPVGNYAMSKASGELMVRMYEKSLCIRTSFVPNEFPHAAAFRDQHTTRDYVDVIGPLVLKASLSGKKGIAHVGTEKKTVYELARRRKKDVKEISIVDVNFYLPPDTSLGNLE